MRKVTVGLATSLDNYIARKDGGADWLRWSAEISEISAKFMKTVDVILIGRKTYEVMLKSGQVSYPGGTNYVFSRSSRHRSSLLRKIAAIKQPDANVQVVDENAASFLRKLKKSKGKGIVVFGGGALAKSLFAADLIDEIVLNIHPVLLGSGIPLFHQMRRQIDLEFGSCRPLKEGGLIITYRVKH